MRKLTLQYLLSVEEYANIKRQGKDLEQCLENDSFKKLWNTLEENFESETPKSVTISADEACKLFELFIEAQNTVETIQENLWIENQDEVDFIPSLKKIYLKDLDGDEENETTNEETKKYGKKKCKNCEKIVEVRAVVCECGYNFGI